MATIMAMIAPMNTVPQNKGIEPNAPEDPAWSARIAVCGLQMVPNRNSPGLTRLKKRSDFEHQRQDDAERRQDGDQRGGDEQPHHPALDPGPRPEIDADPAQGARRPPASASRMATPPPIAANSGARPRANDRRERVRIPD